MTFKPWSKNFNPRIDGESVADWLRREVDTLMKDGGPSRSITITPREALQLLALIPAAQPESSAIPQEWRDALSQALPYVRDESDKYEDDGANEPLDLAGTIADLLAQPAQGGAA